METVTETRLECAAVETGLIVFRSSLIHGRGGFAKQKIRQGSQVIEYVGERIDKAESLRRCEQNNEFIFSLNESQDLDGNVPWNPARFINHSCAPNCEATFAGKRDCGAASGGIAWLLAGQP